MEAARVAKALGSSLEARVTLHVEDEALGAWVRELDAPGGARGFGVDRLRFLLIVSETKVRAKGVGRCLLVSPLPGPASRSAWRPRRFCGRGGAVHGKSPARHA